MDLVIRNATVWGLEGRHDIGITGERIAALEPRIGESGGKEIDAAGMLLTPAFVDPHIHLDKVLILREVRPNKSGTLTEAIEIGWERKRTYTVEDIVRRAGEVIEAAVASGTTRIRTHVDVDTIGGLKPVEGLVAARERYRDLVDIQIVAFPQEGILKDPGTEELMRKAMELGADVVGGMPWNERSLEDSRRHIEIAFAIAKRHDADIDMHVDETDDPRARTLEILADLTKAEGYGGRVTAGHTCALAAYPDRYARKVIRKLREAGVHMITNPATNLMLQGRLDKGPVRRGITRVRELLEAGVNVAMGQDCVLDAFYPFGRADMLEVALITAHAAHLSLPPQIETVFRMATVNAARALRVPDYGIAVGNRADLILLPVPDVAEAIRLQTAPRYVVRAGRVVAETIKEQRVYRG